MPGFDAHKNLAVSLVATAPSPAASGTSLAVTAGEGTRFPAAPFPLVVGPVGTLLTPVNAEIVRVTAIATDTFTIQRAQEGTSARTILVGDQVAAAITAKTLSDIESNEWTYIAQCTADRSTSSTTFVDVPDLSITVNANTFWQFEASLLLSSSSAAGVKVTLQFSAAGSPAVFYFITGPTTGNTTYQTLGVVTFQNSNNTMVLVAGLGYIEMRGFIQIGSAGGNLTIQQLKVTSGTSTVVTGSTLKVRRVN
jgi:hypothetical protein